MTEKLISVIELISSIVSLTTAIIAYISIKRGK